MEIASSSVQINRSAGTVTKAQRRADRIGIIASVLCAIHCALTPVLLMLMPTFGKAWSHPATHWGMALVVIPIAVFMLIKGYRKHGRKWVVGLGALGVFLIIIGAILPYTEVAVSSNIEPVVGGG